MILHVGCFPFPTHQGTQAAVASMLEASVRAGRRARLLAYAQSGYEAQMPYEVDRVPDFPRVRSLRSGPSWGKVALDVQCALAVRRTVARVRPRAIVAHHIEGAWASLAAGVAPVYYVAHTDLERELPVYLPDPVARVAGALARWVDDRARKRVAGVAAVAPALAARLGERTHYLPIPWPPRPPIDAPARTDARAALGIDPTAPVCLYAGNLDAYQGWEDLVGALACLRASKPDARLLIATQSDAVAIHREARRGGVAAAVDVRPLDGERARALAHAASDLAWIPRRVAGGLPIKMLDAFARGLPVVAMKRATAGLDVAKACAVVADDDGRALASAAARLLEQPETAQRIARGARAYLATHHGTEAFIAALDRLTGESPPRVRPRPAAQAPRAR